jgi:hypothetical protein
MKYAAMAVNTRPNKIAVKSNFFMMGQTPGDLIEYCPF